MQKILQRIYSFFIFNAVPKIILRGFVRDSFVSGIFSVDLAVPIGRG
jgi:F-type H+/Na+-transporting ATPase subunit alpha